jgi:hypothetical protein
MWALKPTRKAIIGELATVDGRDVLITRPGRFYFASQVSPEGGIVQMADVVAAAHGEVYWELVNEKEQGVWDVRFLGDGQIVPSK